jgi:hypothetical protein
MSNGFDEFLQDLRGELERCVANEETASVRHTPERVPVWRSRTVLVWATALLVVAAVAVGAVETQSPNRPPSTNNLLPGSGASGAAAIVLPLSPPPATSPIAAPVGYSLSAVAARTATDAWAVGHRIETSAGADQRGADLHSLVMHWDGGVWREVPTPDIGALTAVAVTAAGQVWALGGSTNDVLHYDGAGWSVVPTGAPDGSRLNGLAAIGTGDVWIVGSRPGGPVAPLTLHWNGLTWQVVDTSEADVGPGAVLRSVSGTSATNVWAVGSMADGSGLAIHWDGTTWAPVTVAPPAGADASFNGLGAVAAIATNDVWITTGQSVEHWDGAHWRSPATPVPVAGGATISAASPVDVWVSAQGLGGLMKWDGNAWRNYAVGEIGLTLLDNITGVAARASGDVWAVGTSTPADGGQVIPLVLHWNGTMWRIVVHAVEAR